MGELTRQPGHLLELAKLGEAAALAAVADDLVAMAGKAVDRIELLAGGLVDVEAGQMTGFPPVTAIVAPET